MSPFTVKYCIKRVVDHKVKPDLVAVVVVVVAVVKIEKEVDAEQEEDKSITKENNEAKTNKWINIKNMKENYHHKSIKH